MACLLSKCTNLAKCLQFPNGPLHQFFHCSPEDTELNGKGEFADRFGIVCISFRSIFSTLPSAGGLAKCAPCLERRR